MINAQADLRRRNDLVVRHQNARVRHRVVEDRRGAGRGERNRDDGRAKVHLRRDLHGLRGVVGIVTADEVKAGLQRRHIRVVDGDTDIGCRIVRYGAVIVGEVREIVVPDEQPDRQRGAIGGDVCHAHRQIGRLGRHIDRVDLGVGVRLDGFNDVQALARFDLRFEPEAERIHGPNMEMRVVHHGHQPHTHAVLADEVTQAARAGRAGKKVGGGVIGRRGRRPAGIELRFPVVLIHEGIGSRRCRSQVLGAEVVVKHRELGAMTQGANQVPEILVRNRVGHDNART